jgi:hypothetical protein
MRATEIQRNIQSLTLGNHPELLPSVLASVGLTEYYDKYLEANPKDSSAYHNHTHTFNVVLNAYEGIMNSAAGVVNDTAIKRLLLAALFHDSEHTKGIAHSDKIPADRININKACRSFRIAHAAIAGTRDTVLEQHVHRLIRCTEYPFRTRPFEPLSTIMRDADLSIVYIADKEMQRELLVGLINEANRGRIQKSGENAELITAEEFRQGMKTFWTSVVWHSRWGKMKAVALNYPQRMKSLLEVANEIDF